MPHKQKTAKCISLGCPNRIPVNPNKLTSGFCPECEKSFNTHLKLKKQS